MSRTTRNRFAQPFLVGAMSSALATGCISASLPGTEDEEDDTTELSSACPTDKPLPRTSCAGFKKDLVCDTGAKCGDDQIYCNADGVWTTIFRSCNPPPPAIDECPIEPPDADGSCANYDLNLTCAYALSEYCQMPEQKTSFTCDETGHWKMTMPWLSCNPPPPPKLDECPEEFPPAGSSCIGYELGLQCEDPRSHFCAQFPPHTLSCEEDGLWAVLYPQVACNPPPPMGGAGGESPL